MTLFTEQYGHQQIAQLDEQSIALQDLIAQLQQQLDNAHQELTDIDAQRQEFKTTNQATQSGIDQLEVAARMVLHTYGAEGVDELRDRLNDILSAVTESVARLPEVEQEQEPQVIIVPPTTPETATEQEIPTIEVQSEKVIDGTESQETDKKSEEIEETGEETTKTTDKDLLSAEEKEFIQEVVEDKQNEDIDKVIAQVAEKHFSKIKKAAKTLGVHGKNFKKAEMLAAIKAKLQSSPELLDNLQAISQTL